MKTVLSIKPILNNFYNHHYKPKNMNSVNLDNIRIRIQSTKTKNWRKGDMHSLHPS